MSRTLTRREVLIGGLGAAGVLAGGRLAASAEQPQKVAPQPDRSAHAPTAPVAIQRCESFEPQLLRKKFDAAFDLIGGIKPLVRNKTVTIKLNLTGLEWKPLFGLPAYETYQTHPDTVAALCAILADAGAKRIVLVENLYWNRPMEQTLTDSGWDLAAIQAAGRAQGHVRGHAQPRRVPRLQPLPGPLGRLHLSGVRHEPAVRADRRADFAGQTQAARHRRHHRRGEEPVRQHAQFDLRRRRAGRRRAEPPRRRCFTAAAGSRRPGRPQELAHGLPRKGAVRVPRITADIFGARPSDLNIVDGIRTISGGEGHWNGGIALVEPKLLLVGRNGVCTDAVGTAVMGFDPQPPHGHFPFPGDNHLQLLAEAGVGTNDLQRIEIRGVPLAQAVTRTNRNRLGSPAAFV